MQERYNLQYTAKISFIQYMYFGVQRNIQKYKLLNVIRYFKDHCTKGMSKDNFYKVEVINEP